MALSIIGIKAGRVIAHNQTTRRVAACLLIPYRIAATYKSGCFFHVASTWKSTYTSRIVPAYGDVRCAVAHRAPLRQRHREYAIFRGIDSRLMLVDKKCHGPGFGTERHATAGIPGGAPIRTYRFLQFSVRSATQCFFRVSARCAPEVIRRSKRSARIVFEIIHVGAFDVSTSMTCS